MISLKVCLFCNDLCFGSFILYTRNTCKVTGSQNTFADAKTVTVTHFAQDPTPNLQDFKFKSFGYSSVAHRQKK